VAHVLFRRVRRPDFCLGSGPHRRHTWLLLSQRLQAGADLSAVDASGNRPLDLARYGQSPQHRDVAQTLTDAMRKWRADQAIRKVE